MTLLVLVFTTTIFITSCGDDSKAKTTTKTEAPAPKAEEAPAPKAEEESKTTETASGDAAKGKELFATKTCGTCHNPDKKVVGPSIQTIAKKYAETGANMVDFMNGKSDAIVDTDPGQVAVMKANIDGILKSVTDSEKADIAAYMLSLK